ncbi:MAG: hypothetical protein ACHBN1_18185 [Heteroscytonema crispum UTEX LB 1556]
MTSASPNISSQNKMRSREFPWHLMGNDGAIQYLEKYGKGISAIKVISLAICAESEGYLQVRSHRLTENGKLWHGRYIGLCEEYTIASSTLKCTWTYIIDII